MDRDSSSPPVSANLCVNSLEETAMPRRYTLGLDFGTESVRVLVVDLFVRHATDVASLLGIPIPDRM